MIKAPTTTSIENELTICHKDETFLDNIPETISSGFCPDEISKWLKDSQMQAQTSSSGNGSSHEHARVIEARQCAAMRPRSGKPRSIPAGKLPLASLCPTKQAGPTGQSAILVHAHPRSVPSRLVFRNFVRPGLTSVKATGDAHGPVPQTKGYFAALSDARPSRSIRL
jgi:hypothetical protein